MIGWIGRLAVARCVVTATTTSLSVPVSIATSFLCHRIRNPHVFATGSRLNTGMSSLRRDTETPEDFMDGLPQPLVLGSASFTRKLILREMGIHFAIVVRPIDEGALGCRDTDTPEALVRTLAHAKMDHLVAAIASGQCDTDLPKSTPPPPDNTTTGTTTGSPLPVAWVVLTADQVVTCNGQILEKPTTIVQAKEFVARYGQHACSTVGHVVLTHLPSRTTVSRSHSATIYFRETLTPTAASDLVDALLAADAPLLSCAGGLMIEHPLTRQYVDRIEGSEDSVMGLCKETVASLLSDLRSKVNAATATTTTTTTVVPN